MRHILLIVIWLLSSSIYRPPIDYPVFGVKVSMGPNSQLMQYVCFMSDGYVLKQQRIVDKESFVKIISGYWPSPYNPKRINYFEEHNIDCSVIVDSITRKAGIGCVPLDSLWKIRYTTYPFRHNPDMGWSNKYHRPSPGQEVYLYQRYGVRNVDANYFIDSSFWMLMNDVMDPQWIANYKAIR